MEYPTYPFQKFIRNNDGGIVIMTAIILPILIIMVGMALDYGIAIQQKEKIQQAADSAILAGVKKFSDRNLTNSQKLTEANEIAQRIFKANLLAANIDGASLETTFEVNDENQEHGIANWNYESKTNLLKVIGVNEIKLKDVAQAKFGASEGGGADIHFVLDVTGSMGVPSTAGETAQLRNSEAKCEFSCHSETHEYRVARRLGLTLKLDVVRAAIDNIISDLDDKGQLSENGYNIALHSFDLEGKERHELSSNASDLKSALAEINVDGNITNFDKAFDYMRGYFANLEAGDRQQYVIFLSDGFGEFGGGAGTLELVDCDEGIKDKGIHFITVYSAYPRVDHNLYRSNVEPALPRMINGMRECASDDASFFQAHDAWGITNAFEQIAGILTTTKALSLTK